MKPFLDFAAIVAIVAATATSASLFFQYGQLQDFGIPISLLETPSPQTIAFGLALAVVIAALLPYFMLRKRRGSASLRYDIYRHAVLLLLLAISVFYLVALPPELPNFIGFILVIFIIYVAEIAYRRKMQRWMLNSFRASYYKAKVSSKSKKQAKIVRRYLNNRKSIRVERVAKRNVDWLLSSFGSAPLYIFYCSIISIALAYAAGRFVAINKTHYLLVASPQEQVVLAIYTDTIVTACIDESSFTIRRGYNVSRLEKSENLDLIPTTFERDGHAVHLVLDNRICAPHK